MNKLFYNKKVNDWNEALPIGNGRLGAMIFGDPYEEHYQLNEDSVWYGKPIDRHNPNAFSNLELVRKLILEGKHQEAVEVMNLNFAATPNSARCYQKLADLKFSFKKPQNSSITNYKRELDLTNAIHTVSFEDNGVQFETQSFSSYPDDVLVINMKASSPIINLKAVMSRDRFYDESYSVDNKTVAINGNLGKDGIDFTTLCRVDNKDGSAYSNGEYLIVSDCSEVSFYLTANTTFKTNNILKKSVEILNNASSLGVEKLKENHILDYKKLYDKCVFEVDYDKELDSLTTFDRLERVRKGENDSGLISLLFNYGRYLLISSSRDNGLPANLQGIWNELYQPPWDSKYTVNINLEMNYWGCEVANLSKCHMPIFDLLERICENGKVTAKKMYGCRGFVLHHNTDIYADTAPQDNCNHSTFWVGGGAWLSQNIYTHYEYTKDIEFLKKYFYILKEATLFYLDYMIDYKGYLATCPSSSPENTFITNNERGTVTVGATMDNQLIRDLFNIVIKCCDILGCDFDLQNELKQKVNKLLPNKIGSKGQLLEWIEEYEEVEKGHRHVSHLYGAYPSRQINIYENKELADAVIKSLEIKLDNNGAGTGWSAAWLFCLFARLGKGDLAYKMLNKILSKATLNNMFNAHPPFQIDGNFGAVAGVCECLMYDGNDYVVLLPSLFDEIKTGSVKGMRLRSGGEIDIEWKDSKLVSYNIKSDKNIKVYYNGKKL